MPALLPDADLVGQQADLLPSGKDHRRLHHGKEGVDDGPAHQGVVEGDAQAVAVEGAELVCVAVVVPVTRLMFCADEFLRLAGEPQRAVVAHAVGPVGGHQVGPPAGHQAAYVLGYAGACAHQAVATQQAHLTGSGSGLGRRLD